MSKTKNGSVKIISGKWRGRNITFPDAHGLRPTHSRLRETLFNWISPYIQGSTCLDLFSGSGALGFEAASRGAAEVLLVENNPEVIKSLEENKFALKACEVKIKKCNAISFSSEVGKKNYDIIFLDPPFEKDLLKKIIPLLHENNILKENGFLYVEKEIGSDCFNLPKEWEVKKEKKTATICYMLIQRVS